MSKVLIGYVKKWNYLQEGVKEKLSGQPKEGSIYRIIYDESAPTSDSLYQIYIGKDTNPARMDTVFLGSELKGEHHGRWEFEIDLINKENYLDYTFKHDELPVLKKWLDSNNSDLIDLMTKNPVPVDIDQPQMPVEMEQTITTALRKVMESENEYDKALDRLSKGMNTVVQKDVGMTFALSELIHYISKTYKEKYENAGTKNISRDFLMTSPTPHATCFNSLKYIQRYSTTGFDKSGKVVDIYKAIHYLLFELQRSKLQNDKN